MESGDQKKSRLTIDEQTGSFFMDGLTYAPGAGKNAEIALPEPTDEFCFIRVLGAGGMGVVFEAEETRTGRRVALKVIAPRLSPSQDVLDRFQQEARASASLSHDHCVFVYGAYQVHNNPAIAMELMSGETLDDRIKSKKKISILQAVKWTHQMLEGLSSAHESNLIHRDIKPSNIFMAANNTVKVGDFGLTQSNTEDLSQSQSGVFMGSPLFASPEQVRGYQLDHRSDLYSVGATLYALLSGSAPHTSTTIGDLFAKIATEDAPSLRTVRRRVPKDLEAIVFKALAKKPEDRFDDCAAFQQALAPFLRARGGTPQLSSRIAAYCIDTLVFLIPIAALAIAQDLLAHSGSEFSISLSMETTRTSARFIFALHFVVIEGRYGASLGKRILGLRVVTMSGDRPGIRRAFLRYLIFDLDFLMSFLGLKSSFWGWIWFAALFSTASRRSGRRGLHERVSGTRVIEVNETFFKRSRARDVLDPKRNTSELPQGSCGPYQLLDQLHETNQGDLWLGRDEKLGRDVWILSNSQEFFVGDDTNSNLHFLDRIEDSNGVHRVFEAPGGAPLLEYVTANRTLPWPIARQVILDLIGILSDSNKHPIMEQVWIDRKGKLRLLPFCLSQEEYHSTESFAPDVCRAIFGLNDDKGRLPEDIPQEARSSIHTLISNDFHHSNLKEMRKDIDATDSNPRFVPRATRMMQLAFSSLVPIASAIAWLVFEFDQALGSEISNPEDLTGFQYGALCILLPGIISAYAFRGSLGFTVFSIRIVDSQAHRISRFRCAYRAALTWLPLVLIPLSNHVTIMFLEERWVSYSNVLLFVLFVLIGCSSIWTPSRSRIDAILGTNLVR